tara:strand:+ start:982 stop:1821 length:840 start_codon:yes stop_codon:yes gene_type:complete
MANKLKYVLRTLLMVTIGLFLGTIATKQANNVYKVPSYEEITNKINNAEHRLVSKQKRIIERSRKSAVRILSMSIEHGGSVASSSGTYVTMFDHYYIITTNHGIVGNCRTTKIVVDDTMYECINLVERNVEADYALIQIGQIDTREPIRIPQNVARTKREWISALSVMSRTYYTGFPNGLGPLTIDGKIMGHSHDDYIYMNSYAWSGSSGSGVFSQRGDYIGYVLAIDVGPGFNGPAILENVVLVVPAYRINWASALDALNTLPEPQETANYKDTNSED